jgi:hypothetical protein
MSNKKSKKKAKKIEDPEEARQTTGNDYYAEAEGVKTLKGTTIIVNINTGAPPNPNPPPGGGKP